MCEHSTVSGILDWTGTNKAHLLATERSGVETALFQELSEGAIVLTVEVDSLDLRKRALRLNERPRLPASRYTDEQMHR